MSNTFASFISGMISGAIPAIVFGAWFKDRMILTLLRKDGICLLAGDQFRIVGHIEQSIRGTDRWEKVGDGPWK